jgi:hypothetical protein
MGGVKLPQALAELGLIDEYEFVVHPRLAGHGADVVCGAFEACRLEAREPAGIQFGGWRCGMSRERSRRTVFLALRSQRANQGAAANRRPALQSGERDNCQRLLQPTGRFRRRSLSLGR